MKERLKHVPSQLSGGEQQRVTIARAMANNPEILLLDEPTGDLDTINTAIVMKLLLDLNAEGITLVMVTHDVGLKMFADRVVWMRDGKIQRIEATTPAAREESRRKLDQELENIEKKRAGLLPRNPVTTIIRAPSDYHHLSWAKGNQKQTQPFNSNNNDNNHSNNHQNESSSSGSGSRRGKEKEDSLNGASSSSDPGAVSQYTLTSDTSSSSVPPLSPLISLASLDFPPEDTSHLPGQSPLL